MNDVTKEILQHGGIEYYLYAQQYKNLLRFITCGSVDDGKSTLIGRLLYDTGNVYNDQLLSTLTSQRFGDNKINLALLVDGLQDERAQGITIDVAYRFFSTKKRKFIIADSPGHEQYTCNMVTAASTSQLALLVIDVQASFREQTKRHIFVNILLGIRNFIIVINKMDLVGYNQRIFDQIQHEYSIIFNKMSVGLNLDIKFIPLSALNGDNVIKKSKLMPWYSGDSLLSMLENIKLISIDYLSYPLRFPIQYVNYSNLGFRGYSGTLVSGKLCCGQEVQILPSKIITKIKRIVTFDGDKKKCFPGEALTLVLSDDVDISRGDLLVNVDSNLTLVHSALLDIVWMSSNRLLPEQDFYIKIAYRQSKVKIKKIHYQVNTNDLLNYPSYDIPCNGIGIVEVDFYDPLFIDRYSDNKIMGGMILIDCLNNITAGAGMVRELLINNCTKKEFYSDFELSLNSLICRYFPHWKSRNLLKE